MLFFFKKRIIISPTCLFAAYENKKITLVMRQTTRAPGYKRLADTQNVCHSKFKSHKFVTLRQG